MNQFVPGNLVVAGSVVMAGFSICEMCMPVHDDRKWWSCGEASGNSSDISVTDGGGGQSQWVWQQVISMVAPPCSCWHWTLVSYSHCSWGRV